MHERSMHSVGLGRGYLRGRGTDNDWRHPLPTEIGKAEFIKLAYGCNPLPIDLHGDPL
jgi:hypothetical protein